MDYGKKFLPIIVGCITLSLCCIIGFIFSIQYDLKKHEEEQVKRAEEETLAKEALLESYAVPFDDLLSIYYNSEDIDVSTKEFMFDGFFNNLKKERFENAYSFLDMELIHGQGIDYDYMDFEGYWNAYFFSILEDTSIVDIAFALEDVAIETSFGNRYRVYTHVLYSDGSSEIIDTFDCYISEQYKMVPFELMDRERLIMNYGEISSDDDMQQVDTEPATEDEVVTDGEFEPENDDVIADIEDTTEEVDLEDTEEEMTEEDTDASVEE